MVMLKGIAMVTTQQAVMKAIFKTGLKISTLNVETL